MPTTIFDSSLITQRNKNKAIANSFISRIQNPSPANGSAPLLGITQQSLINSVINGQSTYYRKTDSGCTSINLGCPCAIENNTVKNGGGGGNMFNAPTITVSSFSINTCTLSFIFFNSFVITEVITDPTTPLPSGWSILSFSNTQIILLNSGVNPASIPPPGIKFIFKGSAGETTNSSNYVTGIQTAGLNPNYWATNMGSNTTNTNADITSDASGNFYIIGTFSDSTFEVKNYSTILGGTVITTSFGTLINSGLTDIYLIKYNSLGQVVWVTTVTGINIENASSVTTDLFGNIYVTGWTNSNITINDWDSVIGGVVNVTPFGILNITSPGANYDMFVIKYNQLGKAQWATRIGSTSTNRDERAVAICTDSVGDIYVTGSSNSTNGINITSYNGIIGGSVQLNTWGTLSKTSLGFDAFIVKYDNNNGQAQWATINRKTTGNNFAYDIIYNPNNNSIYFMGITPSNTIINSYNSVVGGNVVLTSLGTLTLVGSHVYVIQYNLSGQAQRVTTITTGLNSKFITDNLGNIYISGYNVTSNLLINNSAGGVTTTPYATLFISSGTNTDGYIVKYDSTLQAQWGTTITGSDNNGILDITSDGTYIYVVGFFISSAINVNDYSSESSGTIIVTPYGSLAKGTANNNYYIAKYDNTGKAQWTTRLDGITSTVASARITTDSSGNVCVTGFYDSNPLAISAFSSESGGTINVLPYANLPTIGTNNSFVIKLNNSGQFS